MRPLFGLLILLCAAFPVAADELTDALLSIDPRDRQESGIGRVYDDAYGPDEPQAATEDEAGVGLSSSPASLGSTYEGLRSSWYEPTLWPPREPQGLSPDSPDTSNEGVTDSLSP
jgi:hypothetical protein